MKQQTTIEGSYCVKTSQHCRRASKSAGNLKSEEDFNSLKLDCYCLSAVAKQPPADRIFCCWEESWEKVKVRHNGDQCHSAHLATKYGNPCWVDADDETKTLHKSHPDCIEIAEDVDDDDCGMGEWLQGRV